MPRCPTKDYADRCQALALKRDGLTHVAISHALHRPERWVRRTVARYDAQAGLVSLQDRPSRPQRSPRQTAPDVEQAICQMKQAHPGWGRRQIAKQLRWQWRDDATHRVRLSDARVRCVLKRHPELTAPVPPPETPPARQIDYVAPNLLWGADYHHSRLADGSTWETLHWLDLYSRYDLGQVTAASLTEDLIIESFLTVAKRYGLPLLIKTDRDKLFYEPTSGLPTLFERVMAALDVTHLPVGPHQPWWNGVVERRIQTCQSEVRLPAQGDAAAMTQALEAERLFYDQERCHSRCGDHPPATVYTPSTRAVPADFDLAALPPTLAPTVVTRQVQADGRLSLGGRTYHFSRRYARQTATVTVDGWTATAQAADGWQRQWDLHPSAAVQPAAPPPSATPLPLTRKVDARGSLHIRHRLYYVGVAWAKQTLTLQPHGSSWAVTLPDGATKVLPNPQTLPVPGEKPTRPARPRTPPIPQPDGTGMHRRRVTKTGQVAFHNRLYYAGIALHGQTVQVIPLPDGLAVYTTENAWITTCPWRPETKPVEPLCPP